MRGSIHTTLRSRAFIVTLLSALCSLFPSFALAQVVTPPDPAVIEAYINDHKKQRSVLLMRSTVEQANAVLHNASKEAHKDYRDLNVDLDKYTRCFDVIDLIYSSVATGFNFSRTVGVVKEDIEKYKDLLNDYKESVLKHGLIESADTLIITTNLHAIEQIADECSLLYQTITKIALYTSAKTMCKAETLTLMINNVNDCLTRIREIIEISYFHTFQYIKVRTTYWKGQLYRSVPIIDIGNDAFTRWKNAAKLGY